MNNEGTIIRRTTKIEELEGCYYKIPEYVYYKIPVEYHKEVVQKFSFKKLLTACISLFVFVSTFKYLINDGFQINSVCASFPIFVISLLIFYCSVSTSKRYVAKDSQIIEAEVKNVEVYKRGQGSVAYIATLYVPSVNKEVEVNFGQSVTAGRQVVIVKTPNYPLFIKMHDNYVPQYMSEDRS
ncbi:MAG: hypothetical protein Q4F95_09025 [Oscillospiraceae bacterium]|nr:hypothetical protein [Oscillospiraceae bacterium]